MVTNSIHHTGCHQLNREPGFVDCKITLWKMVVSNPTLRKASAGRKKTPLARLGSLGEGEGGKESSKLYSHENGVVALRVGRSGGRGRGRVCLFSGTWYEKLSRSLLFCFRFPQPSRCDVHSGLPFPCYATLRRGASG